MPNQIREIIKSFVLVCSILCTTYGAVSTDKDGMTANKLVLITSSITGVNANGDYVRKNVVSSVKTLDQSVLKRIANGEDNSTTPELEILCKRYIEQTNLDDETGLEEISALLDLLNCRNHKQEQKLFEKVEDKFKISKNYTLSPIKLFFIGYIPERISLDDLIQNREGLTYTQNMIEDYTEGIMGKMPIDIVKKCSDECYNRLEESIEKTTATLDTNEQLALVFFWGNVAAYKQSVEKYKFSSYFEQIMSVYVLLYDYVYKKSDFELQKYLITFNENLINGLHTTLNTDELVSAFEDGTKTDRMNNLKILMNVFGTVSQNDIRNAVIASKANLHFFQAMHTILDIVSASERNLIKCLKHFILLTNN